MQVPNIITKDYVKKLDDNDLLKDKDDKLFKSLTLDIMFKNLIEKNIEIFKLYLFKLLHIDNINEIKFLNTELPVERFKEYKRIVDFNILVNNNKHIDLELNSQRSEEIVRRNYLYLSTMVGSGLNKGDVLSKLKKQKYIQLNINSNKNEKSKGKEVLCLYSKAKNKTTLEDFLIIYYYYIEYYKEKYYNKDVLYKEEYFLASLGANNFSELYEICGKYLTEEERNKVMKEVIEMSSDERVVKENILRNLAKVMEEDMKEYAYNEGTRQGIEQNKISVAKSLISQNISLDVIKKATGLSTKTIKQLML